MSSATNRELLRNAPKRTENRLLPVENKPTPLLPGVALRILWVQSENNEELRNAITAVQTHRTQQTVDDLAAIVKRLLQEEAASMDQAATFESTMCRMRSLRTMQELSAALEDLTVWQPHEDSAAILRANLETNPEFFLGLIADASDRVSEELSLATIEALRYAHETNFSEHAVNVWAELLKILARDLMQDTEALLHPDEKTPHMLCAFLERADELIHQISTCRNHLDAIAH